MVCIAPRDSYSKKILMQFIRYLLVQVIAYGIDMGGFILLSIIFKMDPLISNSISKFFAGLFAFYSHRKFTFDARDKATNRQQFFRYFLLLALNVPISSLILKIVLFGVPSAVTAKFISDIVGIFFTYLFSKYYVFFKVEPKVISNFREEK